MWRMLKRFKKKNIKCHRLYQTIEKRDEHKVAVDARKHFLRKKFMKHLVLQYVFKTTKVIFLRKIITKHEQNAVKSGLNIIPAGGVKMR